MPFYKVYKSGSHIEVYEYERTSKSPKDAMLDLAHAKEMPDGLEQSSYIEYVKSLKRKNGLTTFLHEDESPPLSPWDEHIEQADKIDRKRERRLQTLRENAMNLKRMAREYFTGETFFITLTFAENMQDIDYGDNCLKYFIKQLRKDFGQVSWIAIREKQKRGAIHFHILLKCEEMNDWFKFVPAPVRKGRKFITSPEQKEKELYLHNFYWKYGFVNCTKIDFVDDVGAYLTKYMSKNHIKEMEWLENRRLILKSSDIKKVVPLDVNEKNEVIQAIIQQIDIFKSIAKEDIEFNAKRKRVFTNGYNSEYSGQVNYYDVNLDRLANGFE